MALRTLIATLGLVLFSTAAVAEKRIALVIGNGNYQSVSRLQNPVNDAGLIAATLNDLGFEVTSLIDATQLQMKRAIAQFGRDLRNSGSETTGLFYYAGHGVQSMSTNYLLPVDISVQDEADFDILGVQANWVLRQMHSARNKTNIVILDACRDNPFEALSGVIDDGLAEMNAPTGTFLGYATAPGGAAADGIGANSPFTEALSKIIQDPGLPIEQVFKQVRVAVLNATGGLQTPWDASSLTEDFSFVPSADTNQGDLEALQLWTSVRETSDPVQLMLFLRAYPESEHAEAARDLLKKLMDEELNSDVAGASDNTSETAPSGPTEKENAMIEAAQASGASEDYAAYLEEFPNGAFVDFATAEMNVAIENESNTTQSNEDITVASRNTDSTPTDNITFTTPLQQGSEQIVGRSLAELINLPPMYPPIEGLPEEVWKDKSCSNCHQWNAENLCEQGGRYLSLTAQRSLSKEHPFGGSFKQTLRAWSIGGCN